jgi:rubredoxin
MPYVIGYDEARTKTLKRPNQLGYFNFPHEPDAPHANLNGHEPGKYFSQAHFHQNDQFQVVVDGEFKIGRHQLTPYCVHFTRAYTPYGPLVSEGSGFAFMVMRAHRDNGAQNIPEELGQFKKVPDRQPWQASTAVKFPAPESRPANADVLLEAVPEIKDDQGLAVHTMILKPHVKAFAPDPTRGDGQYLVVVKGSFYHDGQEQKALGLVFVKPQEGPYQVHAGPDGLEALVLNFPETKRRDAKVRAPAAVAGKKKWQCELCAFAYDEALGLPHEGIAAGTCWEDVPETWTCPDCSTSKSDFRMVEV